MARILILRPEAGAAATARLLEARGHEPLVLPVQDIRPLTPPLPEGPCGGVLISSAAAVPFAVRHREALAGPILAVGAATARALEHAGLPVFAHGTGGGEELAALAAARQSEKPLLYLAGRVRTRGLEDALATAGVPFETLEVYDTVALQPDEESVRNALAGRAPDAVLVLSVGQAVGFERLLSRFARLFAPPPRLLCLSPRIRAELSPAHARDAIVAGRPELSDLLERYERASSPG